jgi:hypothetical protein
MVETTDLFGFVLPVFGVLAEFRRQRWNRRFAAGERSALRRDRTSAQPQMGLRRSQAQINQWRSPRAPLESFATFDGFEN